MLTVVLATDLILWYAEARNKYNFIRRNLVKIVAIFPFMLVFRGLQFLRLQEIFAVAFSSEAIAEILAIEKLLRFEKVVHMIGKATEFVRGVTGT